MYMNKSSLKLLVTFWLAIFLFGCAENRSVQNQAPDVTCKQKYIAPSDTGFNLLEQIDIKPSKKGKTHLSIQGAVDNATPGEYRVMLSAYDDIGNMTIRNIQVFITDLPVQEENELTTENVKVSEIEEPEISETPQPTPVTIAAPQAKPPVNAHAPDPYATAKQGCVNSYGTWNGTSCIWPTQEPQVQQTHPEVNVPSGGSTTCWQEGGMTVCEWVGEWEEYYD